MNDHHAKVRVRHGLITTLRVRLIAQSATRGRLTAPGFEAPCAIGRSGVTRMKREGDGASPAGRLAILSGFYRPDRFALRPLSRVPIRPIGPGDGWCDEPADPNYNRPVRRPYRGSHEDLARADPLYDLVLVLDWNLRRRARGRGSAIFLHLARPDFAPTAGCVAVRRRDMLAILARLGPGAAVRFG